MHHHAGSGRGALVAITTAAPRARGWGPVSAWHRHVWAAVEGPVRRYWPIASIVLLVLIDFGRFVPAGFVTTDFWPHIASNQLRTPEDVVRLFREPIGMADAPYVEVIGRHYRPLAVASYAFDYAIWGLDRPEGWQITNLAIHLGVCLALYTLVRALGLSRPAAVLSVVVFTSHPAIVATVPGIARRHDTLSALALLLSLNVLLRGYLLPAALLFATSLLVKEISLVAVPFVPVLLAVAGRPVRWSLAIVPAVVVGIGARLLALGDLGGYGTASLASLASAGPGEFAEKFLRFFEDMLAPAMLPVHNRLLLVLLSSAALAGAVLLAYRCPPRQRTLALLGLAWACAFAFMYAFLRVYAGAWYLYQPLLGMGMYAGAVAMGLWSVGLSVQPRAVASAGLAGLVWLHASPLFTPYPEWQDMGRLVGDYLARIDVCAEHLRRPFRPVRRGPYADLLEVNGLLDYSVRSYLLLRFPDGQQPC